MANTYKYQFTPDEAVAKLYERGFSEGANAGFLQNLIDTALEIDSNQFFWQEHFVPEGNEYDIDLGDLTKNPAWTVRQRVNRVVPMADAMAPLSETAQLDNEGYVEKTGSIYQYGKGLFDTSLSKIELQSKLREFNAADQNLLIGFVRGVGDLVKSQNYRLSHMAAQVLSRGGAYDNVNSRGFSGVQTIQGSYIPTANFKKAGAKVWSDATADIPSQMQKIEADFREANSIGNEVAFEWDMNVLLKNKFFVAEVNRYIRMYAPDKVIIINQGASSVDTSIVTWQQLVDYSRSDVSKISPIRVVKESQVVQDITTTTTVKGWQDGVVVLRPLGMAGVIVHAKPSDVALMQSGEINPAIQFSLAKVQNFLYVINKVTPNGLVKAYHTDVIGRYAPVLNESQYHICVDITEAGD